MHKVCAETPPNSSTSSPAAIALQDERKWVESLGVTPEFWSRVEFDD